MAETDGSATALKAGLGGLGIGGFVLVKVCSHGDVVADVGRIAARSADEVAVVGAGAAHHAGDLAHIDEAARGARVAEAGAAVGHGGPDVGLAVDAAEIGLDVVDLVGGPSDDGLWFGEPGDLAALARTVATKPGETVGFVVREATGALTVGGATSSEAALRSACAGATCWIYALPPGSPTSDAEAAWQAADEAPVPPTVGRVVVFGG